MIGKKTRWDLLLQRGRNTLTARYHCARTCLIAVLLTSGAGGAGQPDRTYELTKDGQPHATIVIAPHATRAARLAAYELQRHVRLISGATLSIVDADTHDATGMTRIYVGAIGPGTTLRPWKFLEYAVLWRPDGIVLAGNDKEDFGDVRYDPATGDTPLGDLPGIHDPQGTLHAAYRFLEDACGVRWWNATEAGTVTPAAPTLVVSGTDLRRQPDFLFRSFIPRPSWAWKNALSQCFWPPHSPEFADFITAAYFDGLAAPSVDDPASTASRNYLFGHPARLKAVARKNYVWLLRQRLGGALEFHATHSLKSFYYRFGEKRKGLERFFVASQPDLFAKGHEGPPNQLCYSNEEVVQRAAQDARNFFDGLLEGRLLQDSGAIPGSDYFPLAPNDGWGYCKCPNCLPLWDHDEASHNPFFATGMHSDYWFGFVNRVARELKRTHPDKIIATLAYASYAKPPVEELENNVAVQFCHAIRDPFDTATWENEESLLMAWAEKLPAERRFLWLYYCFPREFAGKSKWRWHVFPGFFAHTIGRSFRQYHELGYQGAFFNGWAEDIDTVLTLKMLNDTSISVAAVLDDYFTGYYREAAAPMAALYTMIEALYCDPANYPQEREGGRVGHQTEEMAWGLLGTHNHMLGMQALMEEARASATNVVTRHRVELFEKGIWSYMEAGRRKYEKSIGNRLGRRSCRVPYLPTVTHDMVNWAEAFALPNWYSPYGEPSFYLPLLRVAHDGNTLYLRYDEQPRWVEAQAAVLPPAASLRLLLSPLGDDNPLAITIDPDGRVESRRLNAETQAPSPTPIDVQTEGWRVVAQTRTLELALSLKALGLRPGEQVGFNAARLGTHARDIAVWNVSGTPFDDVRTMGRLILDEEDSLPPAPMSPGTFTLIRNADLMGRWTFDGDSTEGIARDSSGNEHHGQVIGLESGDARRVPGQSGMGLQLSGRNGAGVELPLSPGLSIGKGPFSVEMWICFHPLMLGGNDMQGLLNGNGFVLLNRREGTRLSFGLTDSEGKSSQVNTQDFPQEEDSIAPRQWTQLVAVWDGREIRCYLNGRTHAPPTPFTGPVQSGDTHVTIGMRDRGRSFRGIIDEVSMYRRAFSPAEVRFRFLEGNLNRSGANPQAR